MMTFFTSDQQLGYKNKLEKKENKAMTEDFDKMTRIEREIEKRMESACEKDGWVVSVAMMPPESTTLHIEKFGESPIAAGDEKAALERAAAFASDEFGTKAVV